MKRTLHGVTLAAVLFTGGVSMAQSATSANPPAGTKMATPTPKGMVEFKGFMAPSDPKAFMERLHYINQSEIKQAELAQKASENPDVKSYAKMMIDSHTAADKQLMDMAKTQKMTLSDMPKPSNDMEKKAMAADKALMEKLQSLKGAPFDSCYMANQVGAHDEAIGKVMAAKQGMTSAPAEMTTMLTQLSQELPKHRDMAYQTLGKLDDAMGVGGAGMQDGTMDHGSMNHGATPPSGSGSMGGATKTK
ncbi:DUF4142 domain-containing protein [Corallococcus sp. AB049A]|uniref:DUF4142 domain-containing protein n=1 Tax=Corallococcus interemptor TaxID=2316720 RepID=A0A3A8PPS3_9BACT|nr:MULTISPECIES: DUF4142 domain-containing protein [Corallococcus]RKH41535.1 DUF4142 domain-containing protein [Corallococcus sp. AB050B]RKH58209.1 DUF4142 domain-containing protein [Corallococcus interemptor]RKI59553.1 DUF4142 domain-containing protein [Corallococcus sp. AB049A]